MAEDRWTSWEIVSGGRPFSETLLGGNGDNPGLALRKIKLLEAGGFPPSNRLLEYEKADNLDPRIYRLKRKPKCWRIYFAVEGRRLIYLHAVCKKSDRRNEEDSRKARRRLTAFYNGESALEKLEVPDR